MPEAFLAVDWGTTNLRAWTVDAEGRAGDGREFPLGVSKLKPGEAEQRLRDEVRPALKAERLPALMAGMIGSTLGWVEAPYVDCPADAASLARALVTVPGADPPVRIVPGLRCRRLDGAPDVMRGEETQILGWAAADPARLSGEHVICHPGTHPKWALLREGRIERFVTLMSGELFDLLSHHGVLKSEEGPDDDEAFGAGLEAAGEGDALAARLFTVRSRVVGGDMPKTAARSYLSGLLIGADVAAGPGLLGVEGGSTVALLGDERLCGLYHRALRRRGVATSVHSGEDAVLAGLKALNQAERS